MNSIIQSLTDNRPLTMTSGNAILEDVQSFVSKSGNPTIKAVFRQSGTEDHERKGIDDVIKTTNINEFKKSLQRFYYLFTSINKQSILLDNMPEKSYYNIVSEKPLIIDSEGLFKTAVSMKRDKINLLESTLKEKCEDYKKNEDDIISYDYDYNSKEKTYECNFYKIDKNIFKETLNAIENSLKTLIGAEYYIKVAEIEKTKNNAKYVDYKVYGYASV